MPKFLYFLLALLLLPCAGWSQSRTGEIYTDTLWIQYVGPNEEEGFSNGYFLAVPRNLERDKKYFLLAEADPGLFKLSGGRAVQAAGALGFLQGYPVLGSFKTPWIIPVFTRVPSAPALRPGGLDREIMQIKEGSLKRPDLQFLAMLKDARKRLKKEGIKTYKKIWLNGFGPSGDFCTRFTFLHPKTVQAAVCGGTDGLVPLPLEEWNGHRLRESHGTGPVSRHAGSMGACSSPSRVFKGKKLPGHLGAERVTIQNLKVVKVAAENNLIAIKGAIPGPKGSVVCISDSVKA